MASDNNTERTDLDYEREILILGHMIKYNLYMLAKSVIFSSVLQKSQDIQSAIEQTNMVVEELDLDTKLKQPTQNTETVN